MRGGGASSSKDDKVSPNALVGISLGFFCLPYLSAKVSEEGEAMPICCWDVLGSFVSLVESSR